MNWNRAWLCLCFGTLIYSGCDFNNKPLATRQDIVGAGDVGQILKTSLAPAADDTSISTVVNTGSSPYLLAGEANKMYVEFLMRFTKISNLKQARLYLPIHLVAGAGSSFNPTVHRLTLASIWAEDSVKAGTLPPSYFDPANIGTASFVSLDSLRSHTDVDTLTVALDSTYVQSLTADSVNIMIRALDPDVLFEFFSRNSTFKIPFLEVTQGRSGLADTTLRFVALADAFVFRRDIPLPEDRYYVGNGEMRETYLRFTPLDSMPTTATINRAILTLNIDRDNSFINADGYACAILTVDAVKDSNHAKGDTLYYTFRNSATGTTLISKDAENVEFNLTTAAQTWLLAPTFNVGLAIEPIAPSRDVQWVAFHTAASNAALAARLKIDYTVPPQTLTLEKHMSREQRHEQSE